MSLSNQDQPNASSLNQTTQPNSNPDINDQSSMDKSLETYLKDLDNEPNHENPEKKTEEGLSNE